MTNYSTKVVLSRNVAGIISILQIEYGLSKYETLGQLRIEFPTWIIENILETCHL